METKEDAIAQIRYLMKKFGISLNEISQTQNISQTREMNNIKKFFAFLGGIFILCGLSIYIAQYWDTMNSAARVIITLGIGLSLYIFAIAASSDNRYKKVLTPLFILAALFETIGMFVTINEFFHYSSDWHKAALLVFGTLLIQQLLTFTKYPKTSLLFLSIIFGTLFFAVLFDYFNLNENYSEMTLGLSLCLISYGLINSKHRSIIPFWYLIGSSIFLFGLFFAIQDSFFEWLFLGICIAVIYISTFIKSRVLLFTGTVSLIIYIGYFTDKHFTHSLGWPLSLILFGCIFLAISMVSIRIGKKIK